MAQPQPPVRILAADELGQLKCKFQIFYIKSSKLATLLDLYLLTNIFLNSPYMYAVLQAPSLEQFDALSIVSRWCVPLPFSFYASLTIACSHYLTLALYIQ